MANHKSSEKRARQTVKKSARNSARKSSVKTFEKKLLAGLDAKSKDLQSLLKSYVQQAMKAASKGVLKKETVARKISRLSVRVQAALSK